MRVPSSIPAGNVDRKRALLGQASVAAALAAGIGDHLAAALAGGTGAFDREEALRRADPADAAAGRAGLRAGARLCAAARAFVALDRGGNADLRRLAGEGLLQRDLHVVAKIGATLAAGAAGLAAPGASTHHLAEDVVEDVGHRRGEVAAESARSRPAAVLEGRMAEPVVGGPLLRVLQHFVGFAELLELHLRLGITRIAVGVILHGELAKRTFQSLVVDFAGHAEHLVVIGLHSRFHGFCDRQSAGSRALPRHAPKGAEPAMDPTPRKFEPFI